MEDERYFFPPGSSYVDGNWALSYFPQKDGNGDGYITISLHPDASYFSLASTELSITTNQDTCEFVVDRSDSDGASGSFECTDAVGFKANGSMVDGITVTGSFDANP